MDDLTFLTNELSLDAAPVVLPVLCNLVENINDSGDRLRDLVPNESLTSIVNQYYKSIQEEKHNRGIRDFNVSYEEAYQALNKYKNE